MSVVIPETVSFIFWHVMQPFISRFWTLEMFTSDHLRDPLLRTFAMERWKKGKTWKQECYGNFSFFVCGNKICLASNNNNQKHQMDATVVQYSRSFSNVNLIVWQKYHSWCLISEINFLCNKLLVKRNCTDLAEQEISRQLNQPTIETVCYTLQLPCE